MPIINFWENKMSKTPMSIEEVIDFPLQSHEPFPSIGQLFSRHELLVYLNSLRKKRGLSVRAYRHASTSDIVSDIHRFRRL